MMQNPIPLEHSSDYIGALLVGKNAEVTYELQIMPAIVEAPVPGFTPPRFHPGLMDQIIMRLQHSFSRGRLRVFRRGGIDSFRRNRKRTSRIEDGIPD
jgi:hypothetical protein